MIALVFSLLFSNGIDPTISLLLTAACACGITALVLFLLQEDFPIGLSLYAGLLAGALWCCVYTWIVWQPAQQYDGSYGVIRLELNEYAQGKESYGLAYGTVTAIDDRSCHMKVKAYLLDGSPDYGPGDVLIFNGQISAAERNRNKNLLQEGIYLTLSQESDETVLPGEAMTALRRIRVFSRNITVSIQALVPGDEGALLAALLSGERDGFSNDFNRALTASGTRHITAVSGLHVTVLAGILMELFGKKAGLLISVPAAVLYAAMVGFSPSVIRATVLLLFWAAAFWFKLERDSLTAFAAALLLLLLWNPFSCLNAGLLLSFAATLGLILLSSPINTFFLNYIKRIRNKTLKKVLRYIGSTVAATLAATLFTLPLNIMFFDSIPLLSLLANLLILWVLAFTMTLGLITVGLYCVSPWAAEVVASWVLIWPLRWMVGVIDWVGSSRFAAVDSDNMVILLACLILLAAVVMWKGKLVSGKGLIALTVALICTAGVFTVAERMLIGVVEIENVGGQPVILLRNEGVSLINSGARPRMAAESVQTALSRWNAVRLETVLCTTGDYRTQSGLSAVTEQIEVERILLPSTSGQVAATVASPVLTYSRSGTVTVSGSTIQLLDAGEDSFALRMVCKRFSLLSLCGLKGKNIPSLLAENICAADILLVDDRIANDWTLMYEICHQVQPTQIVITTNGYSEHGETFFGVPITHLRQETIQFRFLR